MAIPRYDTSHSVYGLPPQSECDPLLGSSDDGKSIAANRPHTIPVLPRHRFVLIEVVLVLNVFLAGFDGTVTASTYAVITSEFHGAQLASWLATSYLVTTTALQPLYGRLSDLLGRRVCLMAATALFGLGCLGCGCSPSLPWLIVMRGLAGAGGGGLMTTATILHTDLVPPSHRGLYQALQNVMHGLGSVLGASLGGMLATALGWRSCFLLQVPVCAAALVVAATVVPNWGQQASADRPVSASEECLEDDEATCRSLPLPSPSPPASLWSQIDFAGAGLLISGLSMLLVALTLVSGSSSSSTSSRESLLLTAALAVAAVILLATFVAVEAHTTAVPLLPLAMLHGTQRVALLAVNASLGVSGYAFLFLMPLFFQAVLLDSASTAGLRLVAASAATPLGGLATGLAMRLWHDGGDDGGRVVHRLLQMGSALLLFGGFLNLGLRMDDSAHPSSTWTYSAYLVAGGFGQGMSYPASLFSFLGACAPAEHAVATYLVYLVRSVGSVAGVAAVSMVIQTVLTRELVEAFGGNEKGKELIDTLTHSVEAIRQLPPDTRLQVQGMYYDACRMGMYFLLGVSVVTVSCSWIATRRR